MVIMRLQHSFQGISGLPEDQYVNTFHFIAADLSGFDFQALALIVRAFYSATPAGESLAIKNYLSGIADEPGERVKIYDLADAMPRNPLYDEIFSPASMGSASTGTLPSECAVALSYSAPPLAGIPPPQLRGRIYLGPWSNLALAGGGVGVPPSVDFGLRTIITKSAKETALAAEASGAVWAVYSPTRGAAAEISTFWCDDAWDIQRRRGEKPTERVTVTVP